MAKSKRSRRPRREVVETPRQATATSPASSEDARPSAVTTDASPTSRVSESSARRKAVDFAENYLYVYTEIRNILVVAVVMFVVMIGLSFFI